MPEIDWFNTSRDFLLGVGVGVVIMYTFMTKTMLAREQNSCENEKNLMRENFQLAMIKETEKQDLMQAQISALQQRVNKLESLVLQHVPGYVPDDK